MALYMAMFTEATCVGLFFMRKPYPHNICHSGVRNANPESRLFSHAKEENGISAFLEMMAVLNGSVIASEAKPPGS